MSIVGDILESFELRFNVILNDRSPGSTVIDELFVSFTLDAIILGELNNLFCLYQLIQLIEHKRCIRTLSRTGINT